MPSTVFDSDIFRDAFGSQAMRAIFSDRATIARYVEVEVALAAAEAKVGVIPKEAAAAIARLAHAEAIDVAKLKAETDLVGYPIVGVVHQLAKQCGEAGRFVHWGATTQDIMDTATVLQIRDALALVEADLAALDTTLAALAKKHRDTVMAGRTHLQHALPVTFGYKAAVWRGMIVRHRQRLQELQPRVLVGQFAGAAGTLASLGDKGLAVHDALMDELQLGRPPTPWHVARDGMAETVSLLALIAGTLAKIATDVMLMMQTEVGEAFEPFVPGRGSSSTMPQKRNPIACEFIVAAGQDRAPAGRPDARRAGRRPRARHRPLAARMGGNPASLHRHRRRAAPIALPAGGPDRRRGAHAPQPRPDRRPDRRRSRDDGARRAHRPAARPTTSSTAPAAPRWTRARRCWRSCRALPEVTRHFDKKRLAELTDPVNYLGSAGAMVDRALGRKRGAGRHRTSL